jgi:hypothetical protein
MGDKLIMILAIQNFVICIVSICEHNYLRAVYWFGASLINTTIMLGMK